MIFFLITEALPLLIVKINIFIIFFETGSLRLHCSILLGSTIVDYFPQVNQTKDTFKM